MTMPSYRNPSGITYGYTTLDEMLPALSKLFMTLLNPNLFTIYDVEARLGNLIEFAAMEIFGFDNAVLSQPKRYNLRLYYA